jgi:hypothetical protein
MMILADFIHAELGRLHRVFDAGLADLTPEQLHAVPAGHPKLNTIAFGLWHVTRTEDNVVRFVIQDRRPTVWMEGGYAERLGLPPVAQGTGMPTEEAQGLRIKDVGLFKEYMERVWASTDELFTKADALTLDKRVTIRPLGEMPAIQALGQVVLTHGMTHFGQLEMARTLLGLPPVIGV